MTSHNGHAKCACAVATTVSAPLRTDKEVHQREVLDVSIKWPNKSNRCRYVVCLVKEIVLITWLISKV